MSDPAPARLITLEGIDGCGKSTLAHALAACVRAAGRPLLLTREPTDGPHGRAVLRAVRGEATLSARAQADLFQADRAEHVTHEIAPALARGDFVICDRYALSTVAYQGARGLDPETLWAENAGFPQPGLTLLLDLDPHVALDRIRRLRGDQPNAFERAPYLRAVRAMFLRFRTRPEVVVLDAARPAAEVAHDARAAVSARFGPALAFKPTGAGVETG